MIVRPHEQPTEAIDVCVVIDVLRATTTATMLCKRLGELCLIGTLDEFDQLPPRDNGYVLFSELAKPSHVPGFDNSPVLARDADLAGRTPVLVTTNGTLAVVRAARFAREIVLASFVNLSAIVEYVRGRKVAVMPAGNIKGAKSCIEDDGCASSIVGRLTGVGGDAGDVRAVIEGCMQDARIIRRLGNEPGLAADIDVCFAVDSVPIVPRVSVDDRPWFLVRA